MCFITRQRYPLFKVLRVVLVAVLALVALSALSCSNERNGVTDETVGTDSEDFVVSDGDGSVDKYDYNSEEGRFNDKGVWEQKQEFCEPPLFPLKNTCQGEPGNWGKALQMALWFFNVNKSGQDVFCTDVQWRGDAHLDDAHIRLKANVPNGVNMSDAYIAEYIDTFDPDGDGEVDLSGGYYDAGDYIKFALTTGYMTSTIAWAMYEFPTSFSATSLEDEALIQIKWAADYFMKNMFVVDKTIANPKDWHVVGYAHQVGSASDHNCGWMPPELRSADICPRTGYFATEENPAADVTANNAAALALVSILTRADAEYSEQALNHAIALYEFAKTDETAIQSTTGGLYNSEYAWDDLAWAALWLYEATKDVSNSNLSYLNEALDYLYHIPGFERSCVASQIEWNDGYSDNNACWKEGWTHVWNSLRSGVFVRLAVSLGKLNTFVRSETLDELVCVDGTVPKAASPCSTLTRREYYARLSGLFQTISRVDSSAWLDPSVATPGGFSNKVNDNWGSGRYNSAGQLVALVYAKNFPNDAVSTELVEWAQTQSEYLLGDNTVNGDPAGKSFVMGFTDISDNYPTQPHHAAGHASIYGLPDNPAENRHIIWGALVNGPVGDDTHVDQRGDYGSNEVTIDYNAALVGALAGNYYFHGAGTCPDPDFPPMEDATDEFYTMAKMNAQSGCRSQVTITMMNESIHPPRYNEFLTARYYFDASELSDAGIDPEEMTAFINYDNGATLFNEPTTLTGPFKCEDEDNEDAQNTWYFVLSYEGYRFWGRQNQLKGPRVTQVDFGLADGEGCVWDTSNDWSFEGLSAESEQKTTHITAYGEDGKLLWGEEPPCHPIQHVLVPVQTE